MTQTNFNSGHTVAAGKNIFNTAFSTIVDQTIVESSQKAQEADKFGFVEHRALSIFEIMTSMAGASASSEIGENQAIEFKNAEQGPEKGYKVKTYGDGYVVSDLFMEWAKTSKTLDGADSSVKREIIKLTDNVQRLTQGMIKRMNIEAAKVYALGSEVTSGFGPGSASPDGKALFATDHIIGKTGTTFDNTATALTAATLQVAIDKFMDEIKMDDGDPLMIPQSFDLIVSRAEQKNAREILNTATSAAGKFSGIGTNSAELNVFYFENNRINLVVSDYIGQTIGGVAVGNSLNWYLLHREAAIELQAFKKIVLLEPKIEFGYDFDTKQHKMTIHFYFAMDHFFPQVVVGYNV